MFLWKSFDPGVASRALIVLLRRPTASDPVPPNREAAASNRYAQPGSGVRET